MGFNGIAERLMTTDHTAAEIEVETDASTALDPLPVAAHIAVAAQAQGDAAAVHRGSGAGTFAGRGARHGAPSGVGEY